MAPDGAKIFSARLRPLPGTYRDPAVNNGLHYYPLILEQIAALPGVRAVGYARAFGNADRDVARPTSLWHQYGLSG